MEEEQKMYCSFCGKPHTEVDLLIAAPDNTFICDICVEFARDIIGARRQERNNGSIQSIVDKRIREMEKEVASLRQQREQVFAYGSGDGYWVRAEDYPDRPDKEKFKLKFILVPHQEKNDDTDTQPKD